MALPWPGLVAHCRYPLHTSMLEGINTKITVIKRRAYDVRDHEYFFLKIRAALPWIECRAIFCRPDGVGPVGPLYIAGKHA